MAKLEESYSIQAVAAQLKNTIVKWKKRIEIKRTHPRKPSKIDNDTLRADLKNILMTINMNELHVLDCSTSSIGDALKRLDSAVKERR